MDGADEGANIAIQLETDLARYEVSFGYSTGRIEPFVGETLYSKKLGRWLIDRKVGSDKAEFYAYSLVDTVQSNLREPATLALTRYLTFIEDGSPEAASVDSLLRFVHLYDSRGADLYRLKNVARNPVIRPGSGIAVKISGRFCVTSTMWWHDDRYDTIIEIMRESFPSFRDVLIEATGPNTVYGSFIEKGRRAPIQASGVSNGHLQMLAHLTALFAEGRERRSLLMFDEPEASLHPYALAVLAKAIKLATEDWNKQVFVATHSPVLISQFDPGNILATELDDAGRTIIRRVSDVPGIGDLLEEYAVGSLYMAEVIAAQSKRTDEETPA